MGSIKSLGTWITVVILAIGMFAFCEDVNINGAMTSSAGRTIQAANTGWSNDDPDKTDSGFNGCGTPLEFFYSSSCNEGKRSKGGQLVSGPLVGHATDSTVLIWAYAPGSELQIKYYLADGSSEAITLDMPDGGGNTSLIELSGLSANTRYEYKLIENGEIEVVGSFKTAPEPRKPVEFTYLFGSGVKLIHDQSVWDEVMDLKPDFQLFGGDNVYSDATDYDIIWDYHMRQRSIPNYAVAIRTIPTLAIWDDHDYGPNNSDGTEPGKENSLRAFKHLWANPSYGTPEIPGIFHTFHWGDVQFFMMDNRYNKMNGEYLGSEQMNWLKNELENSTAVFKIILHGGTIRKSGNESWFEYSPNEKTELFEFIKEKQITGILFNGGDVHNNWYNTYPQCPKEGSNEYDVFEIVSSGWTYKAEFVHLEVNTTGSLPTIKYYFHEEGEVVQIGLFTLESDGRMRHNYILDANEYTCPDGEPDPAYAFPE
ncbi:MAG: alkaline phosphatase D family protein [Bacteroidales bacterium]